PHGSSSVVLIGASPRFAHAGGPLLKRFSAAQLATQRAVALPAPLAQTLGVGALLTVKLQVGANVLTPLLGATLSKADIGGLVNSPIVLTNISFAQQLAQMNGRISRVFIRPKPGHERAVQAQLTGIARQVGANLEAADNDGTLFARASAPAQLAERLFAAISAIVAFMFALNAMLVTAPARRRFVEELRPQGATCAMTVQIVLFDALVLGTLGCCLGLVLGDALSVAVFRSTPDYLSFAFPVGNERVIEWQSVLLAVGAGLLATLAGVLWPLRGVLNGSAESEEPIALEKGRGRRLLASSAGIGLLAGTTLLFVGAPQLAVLASATLLLAMLCLLVPA
ncbi:MAG TPA: FtsX-like permease family protein, partial [Polyangiales bacterium]|nr:FtsX-like permease family protein [Polyangiales bacterium]